MLKLIIFLALAASTYGSAFIPSQQNPSSNTQNIRKSGDAPGVQALQPNFPGFPEYEPSNYKAYHLIPADESHQSPVGWSSVISSSLVPLGNFALSYGGRAVLLIVQFIVLMIVGLILTTSMCTLTPLCTITFQGFGITHNQVKEQVKELARAYITPEVLNMTSLLVTTAVENYMQENRENMEEKPEGSKDKVMGNPHPQLRRRRSY